MKAIITAAVSGVIVGGVAIYAYAAINLNQEREQVRKLRQHIEKVFGEKAELKKRLEQAQDETAAVHHDLSKARFDLQRCEKTLEKVSAHREHLRQGLEDYHRQVQELRRRIAELERAR